MQHLVQLFSSAAVVLCGLSVAPTTADAVDRQQAHQILERGKHWFWNQLALEGRSNSVILRHAHSFHQEVHLLALNDLFIAIQQRLRGEFLSGFLKEAENIITRSPVDC